MMAVITTSPALYLFSHCFQLFRRIESIISISLRYQLFCILPIQFLPFALPVWPVSSALFYTFIRFQTAPSQAVYKVLLCSFYVSLSICIFNTQNKVALMLAGKEIIVQYGAYSSEVQPPCWAGGKTNSYFFIHSGCKNTYFRPESGKQLW